jgi:hypothetical protein
MTMESRKITMQFSINYQPEHGAKIEPGALDGNIGKEISIKTASETVRGRVVAVEVASNGREACFTIEVVDAPNGLLPDPIINLSSIGFDLRPK